MQSLSTHSMFVVSLLSNKPIARTLVCDSGLSWYLLYWYCIFDHIYMKICLFLTNHGALTIFLRHFDWNLCKICGFVLAAPHNWIPYVHTVQGREIIMRGCQLPKDDRLDVCKKVFEMPQGELIDVKHCSLCDSDGCNGTTGRIAEVLLILAAVLLTIIH